MVTLSIIPLLLFTAVIVLALRAVVTAITPPRRGVKLPSCEKCRYPVAGLANFACPECGADLRATGIITRPMEMRRRGSLFGAIAWYTVLCLLLAMVAGNLATIMASWGGVATPTRMTRTFTPSSTAYRSISFAQSTVSSPVALSVSLVLNDGTSRDLEIPGGRLGTVALLRDAMGAEVARAPFDETTIPLFFKLAHIDISNPTVAAEARDLTRVIDTCMAAPFSAATTTRLSKLTVGPATFSGGKAAAATSDLLAPVLAFVIPLVLWGYGIIHIISRRKKLLREAESADKPIPLPSAPAGPGIAP